MNTPPNTPGPSQPVPLPQGTPFEVRARALMDLRREMEELHARLQYFKLMRKLGVRSL